MSKTVQYEKNTVKQHKGQDSRFGMPIYSSFTIQNVQNHRPKMRQIPMVWLQQVQKCTYMSWKSLYDGIPGWTQSHQPNLFVEVLKETHVEVIGTLKIAPVISCPLLASQLSCPDIQGNIPSLCSITLCTAACRTLQWCLWFLLYPPIQCHSPMMRKCCRSFFLLMPSHGRTLVFQSPLAISFWFFAFILSLPLYGVCLSTVG